MTIYDPIANTLGLHPIHHDIEDYSEFIYDQYEGIFTPWNKGVKDINEFRDAAARRNWQNYSKSIRGKTYEEIYGEVKAKKLRKIRADSAKSRTANGWKIKDTAKYKEAAKIKWGDPEYRKKNSYKWITNIELGKIKKVHSDQVDEYIKMGWIKGRKRTQINP